MQDQLLRDTAESTDLKRAPGFSFFTSVLAVYVLSRLILLAGVAVSPSPFAKLVELWDGSFYLQIAAHGYPTTLARPHFALVAFFPLFPLLVHIVALAVGHNWVFAGVIVSLVTGATACLAVGALVRDRFGDEVGVRTGWLFALAPGAAYLSWDYAEGLAITLCAVSLMMLDRRRWLAAGMVGGLATMASPLAAPIVIAAAWAAWRSGEQRAWIAPLLAGSGFASFCLYLWIHLGTPFGWFDAERVGWNVHTDLWSPIHWLTSHHPGIAVVEVFSLAVAVGGLWAMRQARVPGTWWALTVPLLASVVFNAGSWLTPRFLLSTFPLVAAIAIVVRGERFRVLLLSSTIVMVVVFFAYTSLTFVCQP